MAYDTNPRLPRLRARAVNMVRSGKSVTEVARYFSFSKSAVSKWCKKMPKGGSWTIVTKSSAPKHHPRKIDDALAYRIKELRLELKGRSIPNGKSFTHPERDQRLQMLGI